MSFRVALRSAQPAFRTIPLHTRLSVPFTKMAYSTAAEIKAGDAVPSVPVKINDPKSTVDFASLKGKNILVTVPGAFTPTCHSQVPGFVDLYDKFKAKGIDDIYVVTVNDIFVVNAWKKDLTGDANTVKFTGDDQAELANALGLVLDATAGLGNKRLKRAVIVIDNGKVVTATVEPDSGKSTVTHADEVIKAI